MRQQVGMRTPRFAAWLVVCLVVWQGARASAATVSASVDRSNVAVGESFTLTLSVSGAQIQPPGLPALPGFEPGSTGTSIQIINGAVQQAFTFELSPTQQGDLVIPAMQLNLGGETATTQPIRIHVTGPTAAVPGAFVKIVLPKTNLFVGEVIDLEVQVYSQEGRINTYPQLPSEGGFTIGKWLKPTETRVVVSNATYSLVSFKAPLTAVKAGALNVGPVTQPLFVADRRQRGFFFQSEREIRLVAEKITAIALPLPSQNVPATFAGAVGQYSVTVTAAPTNVAVGDPITVRVTVTGRGWLDAVQVPSQPDWREFKMYTPSAKIESGDPNNVTGRKMFEIAVVPQSPGIKALPPFGFSYFDPDARAYRTVAAQPIPLTVSQSSAPNTAPPRFSATNTSESTAARTDIAHIQARLGPIATATPLLAQPWFVALQFTAPAVWLGLLLRRKRAEALANNPRERRRREVQATVRTALNQLREDAAGKRSDEFFATLFRALQEQIGERLDVPASSVTEAVIDERLRPAGFSEKSCASLHELFQAANLARYAPVKSSQELAALLQTAEQVLMELQQWRKTQ
jgi:hypothetical protein